MHATTRLSRERQAGLALPSGSSPQGEVAGKQAITGQAEVGSLPSGLLHATLSPRVEPKALPRELLQIQTLLRPMRDRISQVALRGPPSWMFHEYPHL